MFLGNFRGAFCATVATMTTMLFASAALVAAAPPPDIAKAVYLTDVNPAAKCLDGSPGILLQHPSDDVNINVNVMIYWVRTVIFGWGTHCGGVHGIPTS